MKDDAGIPQHKGMACGDGAMEGSTFGVMPLTAMRGMEMDGPKSKMLGMEDRGAGSPVKHTRGKMPSQAQADHGPHK